MSRPETPDDFAAFCSTLVLEDGSKFELFPEQLLMLEDYFSGVRETLILIPKKNGKTTLLAALALYHVLRTDNAACFVGAASKDQASILYSQAGGLVARSDLDHLLNVQKGYKHIQRILNGPGFIRVMAADENTADGIIPTLALVDELHRHKSDGLYGVFRDGLGPRHGRMITISTAGDDEASPLGRLRTQALALPGLQNGGAYRHVHTPDFAMHEWALNDSDDRDDLAVVVTANPAPWQTEAELAIRKNSPSMTPWQWARFACGVWMFGEQGAFSATEWRDCEDPAAVIPEGAEDVIIGVDLGWKWDSTFIVPVWRDEADLWMVDREVCITPPADGSRTRYSTIWDACEALAEYFSHPTFVIDPEVGGAQLAQQCEDELDCSVIEHSQKPTPMALAAQRLSHVIGSGRLRHSGRAQLTQQVLAAAPKPVGEMWKIGKPARSGALVDGAVALAMAVSIGEVPAEVAEPWIVVV